MSDYIDRQKVVEVCDWYEHEFVECEYAIRLVADDLKKLPSADLEEIMICGYPARHLAFVATVMQKEGVTPEEVASCLRDIGRMVEMIIEEQKEIIEKTWKEWGSV